jgi:hypothetical protein
MYIKINLSYRLFQIAKVQIIRSNDKLDWWNHVVDQEILIDTKGDLLLEEDKLYKVVNVSEISVRNPHLNPLHLKIPGKYCKIKF